MDSADTIGSGNQPSAIGRLLATYRSMESDAQVFLDNIILASVRILGQITQLARSHLDPSSLPEDLVRWRIFTLSRVGKYFFFLVRPFAENQSHFFFSLFASSDCLIVASSSGAFR